MSPALATGVSVSGTITTSGGSPYQSGCVLIIEPETFELAGSAVTAANGTYQVQDVASGAYLVLFADCASPATYAWTWWPNAASLMGAELLVVDTDAIHGIDGVLVPGARLSGTVLGGGDAPTADVCVGVVDANGELLSAIRSDEDGTFTTPPVRTTTDVLLIGADCAEEPRYLPTWYPGTLLLDEATSFTLAVGEHRPGLTLPMVPMHAQATLPDSEEPEPTEEPPEEEPPLPPALAVKLVGGSAAISSNVEQRVADLTGATVHRLAGPNRYDTAAAIVDDAFTDTVDTVYLATGANYPDALAASAAAATTNAPVLLTDPTNLPDATITELHRLDPATIKLVGGSAAISSNVEQRVADLTGATVHRLAGPNRYDTAAAIVDDAFTDTVDTVYLATGANYPDALAASAAAATTNAPVLLTDPTNLPDATITELHRLDPATIERTPAGQRSTQQVVGPRVQCFQSPYDTSWTWTVTGPRVWALPGYSQQSAIHRYWYNVSERNADGSWSAWSYLEPTDWSPVYTVHAPGGSLIPIPLPHSFFGQGSPQRPFVAFHVVAEVWWWDGSKWITTTERFTATSQYRTTTIFGQYPLGTVPASYCLPY